MEDACGAIATREELVEGLLALALTFDEVVFRNATSKEVLSVDDISEAGFVHPFTVSMKVQPSEDDYYVQFGCRVSVGADCRLVGVDVVEQKGLDCETEAAIRAKLSERLAMDGDMMSLFFYAIELADEHNRPHGICSLCREALVGNEATNEDDTFTAERSGKGILRFGCFHCFHADCFWDWFDWKQLRLAEKVAELREDHNNNQAFVSQAMADAEIELAEGSDTVFVLQCPNCRERMWPLPDRGKRKVGCRIAAKEVSVDDLSADVREMVRRLQLQQAAGIERQRTVGGVI